MYIEKFDLLRGLDREFVKEFVAIGAKEPHEEGDSLFSRGDKANYLYILIKGRVKLTIGDMGQIVHVVDHTGEAFGWSSLVDRCEYSASAECRAPTRVLRFEKLTLQQVLEKYPASGLIFYKRLAGVLGNRLLRNYEMVARGFQSGDSLSFGSGQVLQSPAFE